MSEIDWSKAPEGASHFCNGDWFKKEGGEWYYWFDGARSWIEYAYADPANFSWWGLRIERPSAAWSGEGLPPVGAECLAFYMGQPQGVVNVRYSGECMILWSEDRQSEQCGAAEHYLFSPIRTPEQIAADERAAAFHTAICDVEEKVAKWNTTIDCSAAIKATVDIMIAMGYRK